MKLTIITDGHRSRMCFLTERFACDRSALAALLIFCAIFFTLTGSSIAHDPEAVSPSASTAFHGKALKTIIVPEYYPYSFVNEKGIPDGFTVDIAKTVAQVMGVRIEIGVDTWLNAMKSLEDGSIDFLPMMAWSPERQKSFDFSVPHTIAYDSVFVRKGTPKVGTLEGLSGKTVIIMSKDAAHDYLMSSGMSDSMKLVVVDDLPEMLRLLSTGNGDAVLIPKLVGLIALKKLNITNIEESSEMVDAYRRSFSFALRKGNWALLEFLNHGLNIVKASGQYDDIYRKWFGLIEPQGLPWKTVLKYAAVIAVIFSLIGLALFFWFVSLNKQVALRTRSLETEIERRKQTEAELQSTLSRFYTTLSSLYAGVLLVANDGTVEFANQAFCDLFDLDETPDELHGLTSAEMLEKIRLVYADPEQALARIQEIVTKQHPVRGEEIAIKGGRTCIRDFIPIIIDGKTYGRFWHHSDVTEIKRAAEALMESEERFRLAVATSPDAICITRLRDGLFVEINDAFTELSGYTKNDVFNKTSNQINVWKNPEEREEIVGFLMKKGFCANQEAVFQKKDGSLFSGSMSASVMSHKGDLHIISMTRDITDRLQAEQEKQNLQAQLFQSQKMEALGTLVGGIAHDFNNMLQIMLGYSQFLLDDKKQGEPGYKELETIIETGKGGADLVKKLLAFVQQGQVFPVPLDLNHQISLLSTLISHTLPPVVQIDMDFTDGPTTIRADHGQIDQLVMNLAINASEAMPNGGRLKIATTTVLLDDEYCRTHHGAKPGSYVMLSVSDTGRGINKRTLAKIFDPFFSTKQRGATRGTGLGLSVVKGIVQQHGGHVTCESEPGKGTVFRIYFPAIEMPLMTVKTSVPTVQSGGAETILVVEDNIPVAEFEQKVLANAGYAVISANNGQEAIDIYQKRKEEISLVILDLLMPEMSGRDCLMELLKIDPSVKVLIASGYAPEDELHKEISPLVKGFLHKPFAITQLLNEASSVLDSG